MMLIQLSALLPLLAGLSVMAVPTEQARSLSYPMAQPKQRDSAMSHRQFDQFKRANRACRARRPASSASRSADAAANASDGGSNQAPASSTANADPTSTVAASSSADAQPTAGSPSSAVNAAASSAPSANSSGNSSSSSGKAELIPNGKKAGMTLCNGLDAFSGKLGWCYDWTPNPSAPSGFEGVPMLWGDGSLGDVEHDSERLTAFKNLEGTPKYIIGFEEPDCSTEGSADMSLEDTVKTWNELIAPYSDKGSVLISPSMCHQADEKYLTPMKKEISVQWDVTNLHINKKNMEGVREDIKHYWDTYQKPMWVTEFACVEDQSWTPCTDQGEINQFIQDIVKLFEEDDRIHAYAYSNGKGLGEVWPALNDGQLTASGQAYLDAVSKYH